jgi:hypothetical protein
MPTTTKSTTLTATFTIYIQILSFILCISLSSCIEKTEIEIPSLNDDSKLVIYGALTPGSDVQIFVAKTFPSLTDTIVSDEDIFLFEADVRIYNKIWNDTLRLQLNNDTVPYYSNTNTDLEFLKGETYELFVNVDGFTPVWASTCIPTLKAVWEDDWKLTTVSVEIDGDYYDQYIFIGSWKIPIGDQYQFISTNFIAQDYSTRDAYSFNYNQEDSLAVYESEPNSLWTDFTHIKTLVTADEHFYKYAEYYTFFNEVANDIHYANDGIYVDLFRGIMPEYTNIEDGYGVFGSYLEDPLIIYEPEN